MSPPIGDAGSVEEDTTVLLLLLRGEVWEGSNGSVEEEMMEATALGSSEMSPPIGDAGSVEEDMMGLLLLLRDEVWFKGSITVCCTAFASKWSC